MFDDLNDPVPPAAAGSRAGVASKVSHLRRRRLAAGGASAAVVLGVVALVVLPGGDAHDRSIVVFATGSPTPEPSELIASPTPATSPTASPTTSPGEATTTLTQAPTTADSSPTPSTAPTTGSTPSPSASPTYDDWPKPPVTNVNDSSCDPSPMPPAGPAPFQGATLHIDFTQWDSHSAKQGSQAGAQLLMTNGSPDQQHVMAEHANTWALLDSHGDQVAHLSRTPNYYEKYTVDAGATLNVSWFALWPDECHSGSIDVPPGSYTLEGGIWYVHQDGTESIWWSPGVPVTVTAADPTPSPSASPEPTPSPSAG